MISGAVPSTEFYTSKRYFQPPTLIHHFWIPTAFVESLQCCIISGSRRHSWNRSNVAEQPRPRIRAAAVIHSFQVQEIYMRLICKLHLSSAAPTEEAPFIDSLTHTFYTIAKIGGAKHASNCCNKFRNKVF